LVWLQPLSSPKCPSSTAGWLNITSPTTLVTSSSTALTNSLDARPLSPSTTQKSTPSLWVIMIEVTGLIKSSKTSLSTLPPNKMNSRSTKSKIMPGELPSPLTGSIKVLSTESKTRARAVHAGLSLLLNPWKVATKSHLADLLSSLSSNL